MHRVVVLTGHSRTGKTGLGAELEKLFGFYRIKTSVIVREHAITEKLPHDRKGLQDLGDTLDQDIGDDWVYRYVREVLSVLDAEGQPSRDLVVDSIRTWKQLLPFRKAGDIKLVHVHLYASTDHIISRSRNKYGEDVAYENADIIKREDDITDFKADADIRINTDYTDHNDSLVRVAAGLSLLPPHDRRLVDVIVGGQYGSEGKGHVASYLASEYDVLVRVGGPNAGHTVSGTDGVYVYHHLPSGTKDTDAEVLIGPGATLYVAGLLSEIEECGIGPDRLYIDPQAMIVSDEDRAQEGRLREDISSTGSGSGWAASRRITGRGIQTTLLAKDVPELARFVGEEPNYRGKTLSRLELAFRTGKSILLEGTQGSGLSIYHGQYPYVTSRDTNVAGCLAEAGISPAHVRRILMVVRSTPIRVANPVGDNEKTSGRLKHETDMETVAERAHLEVELLKTNELTSTTKRPRRIGWFEWDQFREACAINAPTDIVLTFADYLNGANASARRFEQLNLDTIKFVEELERVAIAPVSLIVTRFPRSESEREDRRSILDRRNWRTTRAGKIDVPESGFEKLRARVSRIRDFLDQRTRSITPPPS